MPISSPRQIIIDATSDPALRKTQVEVTANGGVFVYETNRDIYVTAVDQTFVTNNLYNTPGGDEDGEVQIKSGPNFGSDPDFKYNTLSDTLQVKNISSNGAAAFGGIVELGSNANVKIGGGANGQVLATNGSGGLRWITSTGSGTVQSVQGNGEGLGFSLSGLVTAAGFLNLAVPAATDLRANLTIGTVANANFNGNGTSVLLGNGGFGAVPNLGNVGALNLDGNAGNVLLGSGIFAAVPNLGNVGAANFNGNATSVLLGNGVFGAVPPISQLVNGNSNVTVDQNGNVNISVAGQANVINVVGNGFYGNVLTANQPAITGVGELSGLSVSGPATFVGNVNQTGGTTTLGNLFVTGTTSITGNINIIESNTGVFFGNTEGFNALYAGVAFDANVGPNLILPYAVMNFVARDTGYSQINNQNLGSGPEATVDNVLTADLGTDEAYYSTMGLTGSQFDGAIAGPNNAIGNAADPYCGYYYVTGDPNDTTGRGAYSSNLVIGTVDPNTQIRIVVGGRDTENIAVLFNDAQTAATSTTTGTMLLRGGAGIDGNVYANGLIQAGGDVTGANFAAAGNITASGNITGTNANLGNAVTANFFIGSGANLFNIVGGNVVGNVTSAVFAYGAGNVLLSGVTGIGNIANINLSGVATTVLLGNGVFGAVPITTRLANSTNNVVVETANITANASGSFEIRTNVGSGSYIWTFDNAGNLTAPGNSTIAANAVVITGNLTGANANVTGTVTANTLIANNSATLGNSVTANFFIGSGANLTDLAGANVTGEVAFAATANAVALANVSGAGNIASINLDGNISNVLLGNGAFAAVPNLGNVGALNLDGNASNVLLGNGVFSSSPPPTQILNGTSNLSVAVNGNVTVGVAGNASILTVTGTGANIIGTANITGNLISGNANLGNVARANFFIGSGNNLSNIQGANVVGAVANATTAGTALSVALANVAGAGNIASINLDGSSSNILYGNGVFSAIRLIGDAGNISNVPGGNVIGAVNFAVVANAVALANVSGAGNIAGINIDGNISNVLRGTGTFAAPPAVGANGLIQFAAGNVLASDINLSYDDGTGTLTAGNVSTGNIAVGNVTIDRILTIAPNAVGGTSPVAFIGDDAANAGGLVFNINSNANLQGQTTIANLQATVTANNTATLGNLVTITINGVAYELMAV